MYAYCGNNPISRFDFSGSDWKSFAAFGIALAIAGFIIVAFPPTGGGSLALAGACGEAFAAASATAMLGNAAYLTGVTICTTAIAEELVSRQTDQYRNSRKGDGRIYSVYFLFDASGAVIYVGRVKTKNLESRLTHHKKTKEYTSAYVVSNLTYEEARGLEEIGMIYCHTLTGKSPNNIIHGISNSNSKRDMYLHDAMEYISNYAEERLLEILGY